MIEILKTLASRFPVKYQQELKRFHFRREMKRSRFISGEAEYTMLESWIEKGDWVLDIGANIGHYAYKFSEIVGKNGRVIAFEPVPQTFELLAANTAHFPFKNITLVNMAASDNLKLLGIQMPKLNSGLDNYYEANLTNEMSEFSVMCVPVDSLKIVEQVRLVKIDVEGHELSVLKGMRALLERDHPILIVEDNTEGVTPFLSELGYTDKKYEKSPNRLYTYKADT